MAKHRFKNVLYHYTTCESLFGMLQGYSEDNPNFTMWATHYAFMNDSSEYEFGKRVCKEAMQIYENRNGITGERSFFTYLPDDATKIWAEQEPYIISMSEDDSSAAMWSMYADGGEGIVLIIDNENRVLMNIDDNYSTKPKPSKCHYCEKSTDLIDDQTILFLHKVFEILTTDTNSRITIHPIDAYLMMPPTFKHKAFEYEKEHRFVFMNRNITDALKFK